MAPRYWMPGRVTWIVLDGSTKEQRQPGVRVDAASRSSGYVLEGKLGLEKAQREGWGRKDL